MFIDELLGRSIAEDDFAGDIEIQNALEDILVQLHHQGLEAVHLNDIAGELSKAVDSVQVNPNEPDFIEVLKTALEQNKWVSNVSSTGEVILKKPGEEDADDEEKNASKQSNKMQKLASKRVKDRSKAGEL